MLNMQGLTELPKALMTGFREPTDEEWPEGVAALTAVIGEAESARQSWRRRLVIMASGELRLTVSEPGFLSAGSDGLIPFTLGSVTATPVALPIADAVALLRSPANPEIELQRRRTFLADLNRRHAQQELDSRAQQLAASARQQDAEARAKNFKWDQWAVMEPWQQALYTLALKVRPRDSQLADDLKTVASSSTGIHGERSTPIPAPSAVWW